MEWRISLSRQVEKFLSHNHTSDELVVEAITKAVQKLSGENIGVDVKQLSGDWGGYYRIRLGKLRVIFSFDAQQCSVFVAVIDHRGNVYKK